MNTHKISSGVNGAIFDFEKLILMSALDLQSTKKKKNKSNQFFDISFK